MKTGRAVVLSDRGVAGTAAAPAVATLEAPTPDDAPTRERVAASLLQHGPSTAAALADRLALTPAAVRRHLDALLADGSVEAREPRVSAGRGRGRPAKVFVLTDSGRRRFPQAYDDLAVAALRFLGETAGTEAIEDFARRRTAELEERYSRTLATVPPEARVEALAGALDDDGYAASVHRTPAGDQLCQHHCPVAHVAAEFPQLCEAETAAFARLLGRHVQRLATLAHGDGVCTTNVPAPGVASARRGHTSSRLPIASTPTPTRRSPA